MANTGVLDQANDPLYFSQGLDPKAPGTATPFQTSPGGVAQLDNFFTASSERTASLTVTITATGTQQTFAHNITDASGNAVAPAAVEFVAGDGLAWSSQAPDDTNIYLTSYNVANNTVTVRLPY